MFTTIIQIMGQDMISFGIQKMCNLLDLIDSQYLCMFEKISSLLAVGIFLVNGLPTSYIILPAVSHLLASMVDLFLVFLIIEVSF